MLRSLQELDLPVVEPVGLVTDRPVPEGGDKRGLLVTRFLQHSMPFRHVISRGVSVAQAYQLLDAIADLLVNLHLAGFFWGDCSLSNALFRLDAGRYSAYLVDAETGEMHPRLSNGQLRHDLTIAGENVPASSWTCRRDSGCRKGSIQSNSPLASCRVTSTSGLNSRVRRCSRRRSSTASIRASSD
jgi:hypothetical protein